MDHGNVYMARNNSLIFVNATRLGGSDAGSNGSSNGSNGNEPNISGHYSCIGVNTAGSALERSQIILFDPSDFGDNGIMAANDDSENEIMSQEHSEFYHIAADSELASARIALMEKTVKMRNLEAESAYGLKVTWHADQQVRYLDGFHIRQ